MTCSLCKKRFGGITAFDIHRHMIDEPPMFGEVGEAAKHFRCLTSRELIEAGLKRDKFGRWCRTLAAMKEEEVA